MNCPKAFAFEGHGILNICLAIDLISFLDLGFRYLEIIRMWQLKLKQQLSGNSIIHYSFIKTLIK